MSRKLAIFDIDGTIAVKGKIPASVIEGLKHLQTLGYLTTVSTGRPYVRLKAALAENFEMAISPDALIIAEHGTKILHRDGRVVQADYFSPAEVEHFVDFIRANEDMVTFCRYALPDPEAPIQLWVKDEKDVPEQLEKSGSYADVFHCSYDELKEHLYGHQISHFLAKLQDFIVVENLRLRFTRSKMNVDFMDTFMQFVGSFSDKGKAVLYLEKFHEIKVADMLIAGNGINDVDMLNMEAGKRVLVGTDEQAASVIGHLVRHDSVIRIESPEALGHYMKTLA